jgi:hypothetical protein
MNRPDSTTYLVEKRSAIGPTQGDLLSRCNRREKAGATRTLLPFEPKVTGVFEGTA